jgi:hypothetical protein
MIRVVLIWLMLSVAVGVGITAFRSLTGSEKWELTKIVAYATICSLVAVVLLGILVVLF